jgi:hypothetical protein
MKAFIFCLLVTCAAACMPNAVSAQSQSTRSNDNVPFFPPPITPPASWTASFEKDVQEINKPLSWHDQQELQKQQEAAKQEWQNTHPVQNFVQNVGNAISGMFSTLGKLGSSGGFEAGGGSGGVRGGVRG